MTTNYVPPKLVNSVADQVVSYEFQDFTPTNNIVMMLGSEEMIKVAKDGFYIRGKKIPQDDKEAEIVYNAFNEFLTWSTLTRR